MNTAFSKHGVLKPPFEGSAAGKDNIRATWTFIANALPSVQCQISMWRFDKKDDAKSAYEKRRSNLPPGFGEGSNQTNLWYVDPASLYQMWYTQTSIHSDKGGAVLVVIEGSMTNLEAALYVNQPLKDEVFCSDLPDKIESVGLVKQDPPGNIVMDTRFRILIEPSTEASGWWRGFKVNSNDGNVLLLDSTVDSETENVVMNFLARRKGETSLNIILYGPNLDNSRTKWEGTVV